MDLQPALCWTLSVITCTLDVLSEAGVFVTVASVCVSVCLSVLAKPGKEKGISALRLHLCLPVYHVAAVFGSYQQFYAQQLYN